jgi:hypothetical protein
MVRNICRHLIGNLIMPRRRSPKPLGRQYFSEQHLSQALLRIEMPPPATGFDYQSAGFA